MALLDDLKTAVADETTVVKSAVTLLDGLAAKLDAALASGDPAAVQAVIDELKTSKAELAAAVERNTRA